MLWFSKKQSIIVNKVWTKASPILGHLLLLSSVCLSLSENCESIYEGYHPLMCYSNFLVQILLPQANPMLPKLQHFWKEVLDALYQNVTASPQPGMPIQNIILLQNLNRSLLQGLPLNSLRTCLGQWNIYSFNSDVGVTKSDSASACHLWFCNRSNWFWSA